LKCERRFTSYERIDEIPIHGREERRDSRALFSREKVQSESSRLVKSGPFPTAKIGSVVNQVEKYVRVARERALD